MFILRDAYAREKGVVLIAFAYAHCFLVYFYCSLASKFHFFLCTYFMNLCPAVCSHCIFSSVYQFYHENYCRVFNSFLSFLFEFLNHVEFCLFLTLGMLCVTLKKRLSTHAVHCYKDPKSIN